VRFLADQPDVAGVALRRSAWATVSPPIEAPTISTSDGGSPLLQPDGHRRAKQDGVSHGLLLVGGRRSVEEFDDAVGFARPLARP
jgi:hypothetical protein